MTATLPGTAFTACFAFFLRYLLGDDDDEQREALREKLLASQDPETGLWRSAGAHRDPAPLHDREHVDRQLTGYALAALAALEQRPRHPLRFLDPLRSPSGVEDHLASLPWARSPSNAGNRAMFVGAFLASESRLHDGPGAAAALEGWFAWHDRNVRQASGYWGRGWLADSYVGMTGAAHQHVLYAFAGREPPALDAALERTLALQYSDGRFWPVEGGGSCYEMDAAQILLGAHRRRAASRLRIEAACARLIPVVLDCAQPDGSFCWARRRPLRVGDLLSTLRVPVRPLDAAWAVYMRLKGERRRLRERRATAWAEGTHGVGEGSLFDTWFRLLTLALVAEVVVDPRLPRVAWRSLPAPNWGHFPGMSDSA